jgi:hypothetical protein
MSDDIQIKFHELIRANHELSMSYIRIRELVGTSGPPGTDGFIQTEQKVKELIAALNDAVGRLQEYDRKHSTVWTVEVKHDSIDK